MATGMVLVIVTRNIDLSVGSVLAVVGNAHGSRSRPSGSPTCSGSTIRSPGSSPSGRRPRHRGTHRGVPGVHRRLRRRIPSFIVTLGGLLVWRGVAWASASGRTIAPMDRPSSVLGGGAAGRRSGRRGAGWSASPPVCGDRPAGERAQEAAKVRLPAAPDVGRRRHRRGQLWQRCIAAVWVSNSYYLPENLARQYAEENGHRLCRRAGCKSRSGSPIPVLIAHRGHPGDDLRGHPAPLRALCVRHRRQPGGRRSRRHQHQATIVKTFALMGLLVGVAAAVSIARLNAAVSGLGTTHRAVCHRRRRHRRDLAGRRDRDHPRGGARRAHHAVAAVGHGAARGRRPAPGHRGRRPVLGARRQLSTRATTRRNRR